MESKRTINRLMAMIIIMTGASIWVLATDSEGLLGAVGGCLLVATFCFYVALFTIRSRSYVRGITRPSDWKEDGNETAAE